MGYHVTHVMGDMEGDPPIARLGELLDELSNTDEEHGSISVTHETEWCLSVWRSGHIVIENLEAGEPLHAGPIDRSGLLRLMAAVADGRLDEVREIEWKPGYL